MLPGLNSRQAKQMMQRMGINQVDLDATEVIIKLKDRKLVFHNPSVAKINMQGQHTYQIVGNPEEMSLDDTSEDELVIDEEDIQTVMSQTGANEETSTNALIETNGDIAEAILKLKKD